MRVHLVRHGPPAIHPETPASGWELDPTGFVEIERLRRANVLPCAGAAWFSSTEPKAVQTAQRLTAGCGVEVVGLDGIREAERPADWMSAEEFEAAVVRSLEHPGEPARAGWEPTESVRARVFAALQGEVVPRARGEATGDAAAVGDATAVAAAAAVGMQAVLVGHGTAWTMLVAALTGQSPDLDGWRAMRMPDHCAVDVDLDDAEHMSWPGAGRVVAGWGSWVTS